MAKAILPWNREWLITNKKDAMYFATHYCMECPNGYPDYGCSGGQSLKCQAIVKQALEDFAAEIGEKNE